MLIKFSIFVCTLFILPTAHPVNAQNMNYAVVAIGSLLVLVILSWVMWGRKQYKGARAALIVSEIGGVVEVDSESKKIKD